MADEKPAVLVIAFDVFEKSTRARKFCRVYHQSGAQVRYLGMSKPGRSGRWGDPGTHISEGVQVHQVPMRAPSGSPDVRTQVRNVLGSYVPALLRMAKIVWTTPADQVHVVAAPLTALGMLHKLRHRSRFVLDVQERPGAVATPGSLSAVFAKVESLVLGAAARCVDLATVVTPPDVPALQDAGFRDVHLVRNAPLRSWRAPYRPPVADPPIRFSCIGTIFQGRAFEALIDATARASKEVPLRVLISGTGSQEYLDQLQRHATKAGITDEIEWLGWVASSEVCDRYLDSDVGLVLYDTTVQGNDGLSNKLMECVAAGRPALCTDAPLNRQFIAETGAGWTTPSDATSLARAMVQVATSEDLTSRAAHCRAIGDSQLSWETEAEPVVRALNSNAVGDHGVLFAPGRQPTVG